LLFVDMSPQVVVVFEEGCTMSFIAALFLFVVVVPQVVCCNLIGVLIFLFAVLFSMHVSLPSVKDPHGAAFGHPPHFSQSNLRRPFTLLPHLGPPLRHPNDLPPTQPTFDFLVSLLFSPVLVPLWLGAFRIDRVVSALPACRLWSMSL